MGNYTAKTISKLVEKMERKPKQVNEALVLTLNKTATYVISESVEAITRKVNLSPDYVKKKLVRGLRAKTGRLRVTVKGNDRATLLSRFKTAKTSRGYRVAANRAGSFKEIRNARMITLRGSGAKGLALSNKDFLAYARKHGNQKTLRKALERKVSKKHGLTVLHGRSINQLFKSVAGLEHGDGIQPAVKDFLRETFLKDFQIKSR